MRSAAGCPRSQSVFSLSRDASPRWSRSPALRSTPLTAVGHRRRRFRPGRLPGGRLRFRIVPREIRRSTKRLPRPNRERLPMNVRPSCRRPNRPRQRHARCARCVFPEAGRRSGSGYVRTGPNRRSLNAYLLSGRQAGTGKYRRYRAKCHRTATILEDRLSFLPAGNRLPLSGRKPFQARQS